MKTPRNTPVPVSSPACRGCGDTCEPAGAPWTCPSCGRVYPPHDYDVKIRALLVLAERGARSSSLSAVAVEVYQRALAGDPEARAYAVRVIDCGEANGWHLGGEGPPVHGTAEELAHTWSGYDVLPGALRPFAWADAAPRVDGTVPAPWRVAHVDRAIEWIKTVAVLYASRSLLRVDVSDVYGDHDSPDSQGRARLWIGLRNNRDPLKHEERLMGLLGLLRRRGALMEPIMIDGRARALYLTDDLPYRTDL